MRRILVSILFVVVAVTGTACDQNPRAARNRVVTMLEDFQKGSGGADGYTAEAIASWAMGREMLSDQGEIARNENGFRTWYEKKGLHWRIKSYEVLDAKPEGNSSFIAIVNVKIEGKPYKIRVIRKSPMEWAD
jgi:hypothetical protein